MNAGRLFPCLVALATPLHAAELSVSDGVRSDLFGTAASISGGIGFVGAYGRDLPGITDPGAAYIFRNLGPGTGAVTESLRLTASDAATNDLFGSAVSISGSIGLVGARGDDIGTKNNQGSAYLFRGLDTRTGSITQDAKLTASNGIANDLFGSSVSISGTIAVIGAREADGSGFLSGAAYVFRGLDTKSGTITQDIILHQSDPTDFDFFGFSSGISGTTAIVGAPNHNIGAAGYQGAAYIYRNLDTRSGTITQNIKLTASDGILQDFFGRGVSISGNTAVVGAIGQDPNGVGSAGAAYVFRGLDTKSGTITQDVKLIASDGRANDGLGSVVSISGNAALAAASEHAIGANTRQGAAYLFTNLGTATGTIRETIKVYASAGQKDDVFGTSLGLDGDLFVIGAEVGDGPVVNSGKAYAGTISSMTTLDVGNATRLVSGLSFASQDHWIVGQTTDSNQVTLTAGDTATVTASGKVVAIGQNAGSDLNTLLVAGRLNATTVMIGATGNFGNLLQLASTGSLSATTIVIAGGNSLSIEGNLTGAGALQSYLGDTVLNFSGGTGVTRVTSANQATYLSSSFSNGYTTFTAVPEASAALLFLAGAASLIGRRRRP